MSQYTINDSNSFSNKRNTPDAWNGDTATDDLPQLLTWLSPLDPGLRHWDIQERRVNDVGGWLMETEEFRKWCGFGRESEGKTAVLFCHGNPGVGKTFISSLVVDRLCDQASGQKTAVSCFYLDFAARKEQSATNVLGSLLKQIVSGMKRVPEEISLAFEQQKTTMGGRRPQLTDLVKMLQLVTSSQPAFMCLDALDECGRVQRARLLDSLQQILEKSPGIRIFATGRSYIQAEIDKRLAGHVTSVSVSPNRGDITGFLRVRLGEDETLDAMDGSLRADILEKIPGKLSEMFRLVSLSIETILRESTIYRRRDRLSRMPDGYGWRDAYDTSIERIMEQDGDKPRLGMEALMWISHAERPLKGNELCHALAVELGCKDFNDRNVPSISTLVGCCQGLIAVDKETSTVRLLHFTLREYLLARPDLFNRCHSIMAEICLTFLNSNKVKGLSADCSSGFWGTPFLNYSSQCWGVHAKRESSSSVKSLALELLREYDSHISARCLLEQVDIPDRFCPCEIPDVRFNGLHCASFFGIGEFVTALIEMGCCYINGKDFLGRTPLIWAARNGHEEAVKILLRQEEIDPGETDNEGRTPLTYAVQSGSGEVVEILLSREEFEPYELDYMSRTPLSYAAQYGSEGVVKILLRWEEVYPDMPDEDGRTPLSYAAQYGSEQVVEILLAREEVSPDGRCYSGRTPLSYAAQHAREGVVKILLRREEVSPDKPDYDGRTPLSYAAENAREGVVRMLLGWQEVNPDKPDDHGRTPLSYAVGGRHGRAPEGVVRMLLGRQEVNPDQPDSDGRTPLSYAMSNSDQGVEILLGRQEVNPNKPDREGRTPLSHAAGWGRERSVKTLLAREDVNPDKPDNHGRTPLSYAAENSWEGVVKILLGREEVNPDMPDNDGRTPLSYAMMWDWNEGVVEILLGREEVNPDKPDPEGRTPLSHAAGRGRKRSVKALLAREDVNPDEPDNDGRTPLSYAAENSGEAVVTILLRREEVNPDMPDNDGRTPLSYAMMSDWNEEVVDILLGRWGVNPDKPDREGRTPLSYAAEKGCERLVSALLARKEGNPNKPDNHGRTPLMLATNKGHHSVVAKLRSHKAIIHSAT